MARRNWLKGLWIGAIVGAIIGFIATALYLLSSYIFIAQYKISLILLVSLFGAIIITAILGAIIGLILNSIFKFKKPFKIILIATILVYLVIGSYFYISSANAQSESTYKGKLHNWNYINDCDENYKSTDVCNNPENIWRIPEDQQVCKYCNEDGTTRFWDLPQEQKSEEISKCMCVEALQLPDYSNYKEWFRTNPPVKEYSAFGEIYNIDEIWGWAPELPLEALFAIGMASH